MVKKINKPLLYCLNNVETCVNCKKSKQKMYSDRVNFRKVSHVFYDNFGKVSHVFYDNFG